MTAPLILKSWRSTAWKSALSIPEMTQITRLTPFPEGLTPVTA
jgi:hypothetical protein